VYGRPVFGLEDPSVLHRDPPIVQEEILSALRKLPISDEEPLNLLRTLHYFVRNLPQRVRKVLY